MKMSNGKEIVLEYCNQFKMPDLEHIEQAIENKRMIEKGEYRYLNGCPSNFGLEKHIGICEIEETDDYTPQQQSDMCERCWKQALGAK
jgi:hypothetical protein